MPIREMPCVFCGADGMQICGRLAIRFSAKRSIMFSVHAIECREHFRESRTTFWRIQFAPVWSLSEMIGLMGVVFFRDILR